MKVVRTFRDRRDAGQSLAGELLYLQDDPTVVVLALPRGGVPVGFEIAQQLHCPLHPFLVRKLGVPGQEELAMGAIASGGVRVLNDDIIFKLEIREAELERVAKREWVELARRESKFENAGQLPPLGGKTVILVDDGLATGATMRAAIQAVKSLQPAKLVVAVPVGSPDTCSELRQQVDELICAVEPDDFQAVGAWYGNFEQTTDEEVCELLGRRRSGE
jgi:predicted phosphoribosyltransferase